MRPGVAAAVVPLVALAGCGGSGVALSVVPNPVRVAHRRGIHRIRHVVVIMQENRWFDSYFGPSPGPTGSRRKVAASPSACPIRAVEPARGRTTIRAR